MSDFEGLDLQSVEDQMDEGTTATEGATASCWRYWTDRHRRRWIEMVEDGAVLVLDVDGDLNELASTFARDVKEAGGELMHFRGSSSSRPRRRHRPGPTG